MNFFKVLQVSVYFFSHEKSSLLACATSANFVSKRFKRRRDFGYGARGTNQFEFQKVFKREWSHSLIQNFGVEKNFSKAKLVLDGPCQLTFRRINDKKRAQLVSLYKEILVLLLSEDCILSEQDILITKVEVPSVFNELLIYWKSHKDEKKNKEIFQHLSCASFKLQQKLSESLYGTNIPPLKFFPDRSHLISEEMNKLFEIADYGMQYRALSHTGLILGSAKETGTESPEEKNKNVPRWLKHSLESQKVKREKNLEEIRKEKYNEDVK